MPSLDLTAGGRVTSLKTQKSRVGLAALLAAFLISVCMVDPIRETAKDDDWAYALTVQRLLEKGTYELHEWSTASMPAQIIWGALFSGALGFSFSALRLSTLALMLGGLIAFYSLFVNRGWADPNAALLVTVLFASPLVLLLSFSFMTDVPFLAWILITMAGCDHAIRGNTRSGMLVASVPASFAILTRQFGAVLPASFALVALLERKSRRLLMPFLLLPTLATTWQAFTMIEDPTASMSDDLGRQVAFAADPLSLASEIPWRATVLFQYMGVFLLPMAPLLIYVAWRRGLSRIAVAAIAAGALYGALAKGLIMPSLPYNLSASANRVPGLPMVMTIASTLLGAILAQALAQPLRQFTRLATAEKLLAVSFAALLAIQMLYVDFLDEYLISFIPLFLVVLAPQLESAPKFVRLACVACCGVVLLCSSLWTFVLLERKEAFWRAADSLRARGVRAEEIFAGEWSYFHHRTPEKRLDDYSPRRIDHSSWLVWDAYFTPFQVDQSWLLVDRTPYRWFDLTTRYVSTYRRSRPAPGGR